MLVSRTFELNDQSNFAVLTGDHNPIHMDPVAARRTQAGAPVVHGVHSLVWLLDMIAFGYPELSRIASLKVRFIRMIYLGERVEAAVTQLKEASVQAVVMVDGAVAVQVSAVFGSPRSSATFELPADAPIIPGLSKPLNMSLEEMATFAGRLTFASSPEELARVFPGAAGIIGARRLAALCSTTLLVGMVVPGLHSIYSGLALDICEEDEFSGELAFKVISADPRFRLIRQQVWGGGLVGTVECFARQPPVQQSSMAAVAPLVEHDEFKGATVFVVGGSRGLGELVAKIVAAGSARVILSYTAGRSDAEKLRAEITSWGATCDVVSYDVHKPAEEQLNELPEAPTHYYYFATPIIYVKKNDCFVQRRFDEFCKFYVSGFYDLMLAAVRRHPTGVSAFYPSSLFVEDRALGVTEYAMAKAAGEILCADLNAHMRNVRVIVSRLPRMPTDQTASLIPEKTADPLATMLPIVRDVQRT